VTFAAVFTLDPQNELELSVIEAVAQFTDEFLRNRFRLLFNTLRNARLISVNTVLVSFQTDADIVARQTDDDTTVTIVFRTTGRATGNVPSANRWLEQIERALESDRYLEELRADFALTGFGTTRNVEVLPPPEPTPKG
jgi:hypothetical protein